MKVKTAGKRGKLAGALIVFFLVVALPASGYAEKWKCDDPLLIHLDIGHSPGASGARSARGKSEYSFNKRFVKEFSSYAASRTGEDSDGTFDVRILNEGGKNLSLRARARSIRKLSKGILLSIHHDSVQKKYLKRWKPDGKRRWMSDRFSGYSLFISNRSPGFARSKRLALALGEALRNQGGFLRSLHHAEKIEGENRPVVSNQFGVFRFDGLAVLNKTRIPAVLVEVGVIVNPNEELDLNDRFYRLEFIVSLLAGIERFCND